MLHIYDISNLRVKPRSYATFAPLCNYFGAVQSYFRAVQSYFHSAGELFFQRTEIDTHDMCCECLTKLFVDILISIYGSVDAPGC